MTTDLIRRIDELAVKVGGRFKLAALIQKRWQEIMEGARPFVDRKPGQTDIELVIEEIQEGKIGIDYDNSDIPEPTTIIRLPGEDAR